MDNEAERLYAYAAEHDDPVAAAPWVELFKQHRLNSDEAGIKADVKRLVDAGSDDLVYNVWKYLFLSLGDDVEAGKWLHTHLAQSMLDAHKRIREKLGISW